jgi:hypothetical protein
MEEVAMGHELEEHTWIVIGVAEELCDIWIVTEVNEYLYFILV